MATDFGPFDTGNVAGYMSQLIRSGYGPTEGLRIFREAGGRTNDNRWFNTYGQIDAMLRREGATYALDPNNLPNPADYNVSAMGRGNQYATRTAVVVIDKDTGTFMTRTHTYITNQPHTPGEAETDAVDMFGDPEAEAAYGEVVMGAIAFDVGRTIPYGDNA